MSPTSSIYDHHLSVNVHPPLTTNARDNSKLDCEKRKSHLFDDQSQSKRRFIVTNISIPEPIIHYSVNNQAHDKSMLHKSSTTQNISSYQQKPPQSYGISTSSSNIEIKSLDFRPLIIHGRRKFGAIPPSSSMIIIKKKSPSPINNISYHQKPLTRSIPVDIINSNTSMVISSMIPSSLSYSSSYSSSSPTSASSTNAGTVFLPIQVTKSQKNNNNNTIKYSTITTTINEGQRSYRYVQKQPIQQKTFRCLKPEKKQIHLNDDDTNQTTTTIPSSSTIHGEGINYTSTLIMDSNVLRLIRRYDPVASNTTGVKSRRSLENTRGIWHTFDAKLAPQQTSDTSPLLSRRSLATYFEDEIPLKQPTTPRLQRQEAIPEQEPQIPPPPPQFANKTIRPILKYNSIRSRSEFIVQPHQIEPLTIEIDPYIPSPNDNSTLYQPLITTGTRRACSALSKSEWDLRTQPDQLPIRPPSPPLALIINQQQEKEFRRPPLGRSKSSAGVTHDQEDYFDAFDENSAPVINNGSSIKKLQQLFATKSPPESNRQTAEVKPTNPIEPQQRIINKPTTIIQENTLTSPRRPILRTQKTIDSPESVSQSNNSSSMPKSEISYDAYRFRRLNDQNSVSTRPRNIAKVEPYSINPNTIRPLYQSPSNTIPTITPAVPTKARINLNSMGNTPTNSSTSSSAGSLGGMIRHSDFLMPNPAYSIPSSYPTPPILFSESLSHGSLHQLPAANMPSYNGRTTGFPSSTNNFQQKYSSSMQGDFQSSMRTSSPLLNPNNIPSSSYHYRPPPSAVINNHRPLPPLPQEQQQQQPEIPIYPTVVEQQQDELMGGGSQQQSRRRFQKRKQMKRSKSVDLYQEPSSVHSPTIIPTELNKSFRQPRSTSREYLAGGENLSSSSSSSASLTTDIERVNRAALLRYKSLDSMAFNNQNTNSNGRKNNNRRIISKPKEFDFDSDDSVCGIPKPRKLCTSSKNASKSDGKLLNSSTTEKDRRDSAQAISIQNVGSSGTSTGITNSVRKNETTNNQTDALVESAPSTIGIPAKGKREGDDLIQQKQTGISFAESQFYVRTSSTPYSKRHDVNDEKVNEIYSSPTLDDTFQDATDDLNLSKDQLINEKNWNEEEKVNKNQDVSNREPVETIRTIRPLSSTIIINPFERLRSMNIQNEQRSSEELSLQIFDQPSSFPLKQEEFYHESSPISTTLTRPLKSSIEQMQEQVDENNDSSTSTATNRSVHLPVEKQRGLSEIIRKRNSRCKVEDYKRSIQKPNTADEQEEPDPIIPTSKSDHELITSSLSDINSKQDSFDMNDKRAQMSIERLNLLLTNDEQNNETDESLSVADKRNLFEIITKDKPIGGTLPRSKSFKNDDSSPITKKYTNGNQNSQIEDQTTEIPSEKKPENESFDDDISKLSFKEKMTLFNKKKSIGLTPTSSLKTNRNRLTQPITAEEVQAAANLTPSSSTKQLAAIDPEEPENIIPVSKRLEQFKTFGATETKQPTSTRKTPTLKYNAKKTNTDQEHRAKTIDIVRLKTDSIVKPKENNKTNGTSSKSNNNVISILKSDTISVLKPDDHLDDFFADTNKNSNNESSVQLNTDDLNRIAENTVRLQSQAARVRPPRRQQQGAKNPLRQIQATMPTEDEYTEVHTNLSEQEVRRLKRAQIAETAGFAQEALAALTSTENFAEINLRSINQSPIVKFGYEPYKDLMLILIKGRRQCSLRLVNPIYESINEGDCYLLITPLKVFAWLGRYANSSEKSKAIELIDYLRQNRDFGLRNEVKYFVLDQAKDDTENDIHAEFNDMLSGDIDEYRPINNVPDDDFYEMNITELNRVYRVENDFLMPLDEFCFRSLSITILDPNEVFVFDFGSELYVWNGKYADKIKRNIGLQLAQQLWNDSYDYSECIISPFDPLNDKNEQVSQVSTPRPAWCIFGKQNQNVETLLFKGKFDDWPSDLQEHKPVNDATNKPLSSQRPPSIVDTLKPADVHKMLIKEEDSVNMILEQVNLGRGRHWYDPIEMRSHDIQTISVNVWHVSENDRHELPKSSYGQFYSDEVYIIRWKYKLSERKADVARDRVAYWIWQGMNANPNEKGISALMGIFVTEEKGPTIHVIQEHEEATFLQLFDGTLTIHMGKHNQPKERNSNWRLYVFLGEIDVETHWWELDVNSTNLRSRTSFLLINTIENLMLLWHGCGTTDEQQILANQSVMKLRERCPEEFHFDGESEDIEFFEMQEGDEIELFWDGMNERNHERKYYSLLNVRFNPKLLSTIRIFHLSSLHGPFVAQELVYSLGSSDYISPFPFIQSDLYELHQPALCLIDTDSELYIWQGWNDQADDELGLQLSNANLLVRGPKDIRFTAERRCALRTAIDYYKTKTGSSTTDLPCSVVYAGLEPSDFINLFPKWAVNTKARQQNQMEGKKINQKDSVIDILNQLCREQYTIEELRARPLPEGVDPSKIESYLSNTDFQKQFQMTKDEFYALPYWKQTNIKKPLGFF